MVKKQKRRDRLHRFELLTAISLVLVLFGFFMINSFDFSSSSNIITGFVSSDIVRQNVSFEIQQSQIYELSSETPSKLTSLRLTGSIEGPGIVKIFLEDPQGQQLLVYSNIKEKKEGNLITGKAVGSLIIKPSETTVSPPTEEITINQKITSGPFYNECSGTCFMSLSLSPNNTAKLIFQVGENTKLKISQITYTTE